MNVRRWSTPFLQVVTQNTSATAERRALIVLNQPFSSDLLMRVWNACQWHACADGGANRLFDVLQANSELEPEAFTPDLIKGDLDSIRSDVKEYYARLGVSIVKDPDLYSTDLMKCISTIEDIESSTPDQAQFSIIILGGLSGRFDQTIHTVSYLHKLRKARSQTFVVTDDNVGWCLDKGEHLIEVDPALIGPTCGLLPVGIDSTILTTRGLQWNLENSESSFDGLVSSSNATVDKEVRYCFIYPLSRLWTSAPPPRNLAFESRLLELFDTLTNL